MAKIDAGMLPLLDTFVFETDGLLESLDEILMRTEKSALMADDINEIFRIMHTVKGSAAMMGLSNMSALAHAVEDLFSVIRGTIGDKTFCGMEECIEPLIGGEVRGNGNHQFRVYNR